MKRIDVLDYARFLAAMVVVAFHYFFHGHRNEYYTSLETTSWLADIAKYGFYGVHFFFLISGYVIFFSARNRSAGSFAAARATRLYPAFWVSLLLTSLVLTLWGNPEQAISVKQFLTNLTIVPKEFHQPYIDGVYWTLWWEVYFYVMVFVLIVLMTGKRLGLFFLLWPLAMLVFALRGRPNLPFLGEYFAFFATGALFAMLHEKASPAVIFSLVVAMGLSIYQTLAEPFRDWESKPVVAMIIVGMFVVFLLLSLPGVRYLKLPHAKLVGALTYPLYLIHQQIGYTFMNHTATSQNKYAMFAILIAGVLVVSFLIHYLIEVKLAWLWKAIFHATIGWPVDRIIAYFSLTGCTASRPADSVSRVKSVQATEPAAYARSI